MHLLQRLRTALGEPVAIENIQVSAERFPGLLEHDLTGSLWALMRSRYGVNPMKADARVVAVALDRFEAEALGVKPGGPAIVLTRTVFDADDEVVELARDVYRGDRTEFSVTPRWRRWRAGRRPGPALSFPGAPPPQKSLTPWRLSSAWTRATSTPAVVRRRAATRPRRRRPPARSPRSTSRLAWPRARPCRRPRSVRRPAGCRSPAARGCRTAPGSSVRWWAGSGGRSRR